MCHSKKGDYSIQDILHAEDVKGVLERQWGIKKSYLMKWKL